MVFFSNNNIMNIESYINMIKNGLDIDEPIKKLETKPEQTPILPKQCYSVAREMNSNPTCSETYYVEGYTLSRDFPYPIDHAWYIENGKHIDMTRKKSDDEYYYLPPVKNEIFREKMADPEFARRFERGGFFRSMLQLRISKNIIKRLSL